MKFYSSIFLIMAILFTACEGETPEQPALPKLSIRNEAVQEGNTNSILKVTVQLTSASEQEVSMNFETLDETAIAGEDYEAASGTFDIPAGQTEGQIEITIIGDEFREVDETFLVRLSNPVNAEFSRTTATISLGNDDTKVDESNLNIPSSGYSTPDNYQGMSLVWQDEFQGTDISDDWVFEIGDGCDRNLCGWGNNELQYYREDNAFIASDEYLVIQARRESFEGKNYTSSRMITQGRQKFQYGRIDIRAAMPTGQGLWPALWMLGSNINTVGWPACGEIDIMEIVGNEPDKVHGTIHWDNGGNYANFGQGFDSPTSLENEWNVYSITWDENQIRWLLNDVQYNVADITPANLSEFKNEFFFIFNVAVGGNWPGQPNSSTVFPQRMLVDYVRVFQNN